MNLVKRAIVLFVIIWLPACSPRQVEPSVPKLSITKMYEWDLEHVTDLQWSPDSTKFIVTSPYSKAPLAMYQINTYSNVWETLGPEETQGAQVTIFSHDGRWVYTGLLFPIGLQVRDAATGKLVKQGTLEYGNKCFVGDTYRAVRSSDNNLLYFLMENKSDKSLSYSELIPWSLDLLNCTEAIVRIEGHIRSMDVSPNGGLLALGINKGLSPTSIKSGDMSNGRTVVWDIANDALKCTIEGTSAVFVPQSNYLIVSESGLKGASEDSWRTRVTLWDANDCSYVRDISSFQSKFYYPASVSVRSDKKYLAVEQRDTLIVDFSSGAIVAKIEDPSPRATDVERTTDQISFSPDGQFLLLSTAGEAGQTVLTLWKISQ